jgi:internalin A
METPQYIVERIEKAKAEGSKELDLSRRSWLDEEMLSEIPEEIYEFKDLEKLVISGQKLTVPDDAFERLPNLISLNLTSNQLVSLPDSLFQLKQLESLQLGGNKLRALPNAIANLGNLQQLGLAYSGIPALPETISGLQKLTRLSLGGSDPIYLPESFFALHNLTFLDLSGSGIQTLSVHFSRFQNLSSLILSDTSLRSLPESLSEIEGLAQFYSSRNKSIQPFPEWFSQLTNMISFGIHEHELVAAPAWISKFKKLKNLYLTANQICELPESYEELQALTELSLWNNQFKEIPECIYEMRSLKELDLRNISGDGNQIRKISPKILNLDRLETFDVDTDSIETPPPEVVNNGIEAIKAYFRQLQEEGTDYLYEAKLLIVGEGGAGKTTLAKKIQNPAYKLQEEDSTEGIEIISWSFPMENGQSFRVNMWDFGGQEIYHATHQFFLTKRSLYLLVADSRKEDTDFYYWLNSVELLSDGSPLLIISNEKQGRQREINEPQLRADFSNLKNTLLTNLGTNEGLTQVLADIKHHIVHLPQIGAPLPKTWVKVRESLEKDPRNHITLDEYLLNCEQNGFATRKDKLQLSGYLHDLGVVLHFQEDSLLKKTVILKPKWGTDAVYQVLDNEKVISQLGRFDRDDLDEIWSEPEYVNMQDELLQLMINFKLCYKIPNTTSYIAPQRLTEKRPEYAWNEADNLILRYAYESFMPKGLLTQCVVALHKLIAEQNYVWKSGAILERDETKAEIIEDYKKREVRIRVAGKRRKELLTIISYELDNIHASYKKLKYTKLIPCNCDVCKSKSDPYFYGYEVLQKFISDRQETIQCQNSYKMVNVKTLIDDVLIGKQTDGESKQKGDFIFQGSVGRVVIQQAQSGDNIMRGDIPSRPRVRSAWANGSFYVFTFAVVIAGLAVLARTVSPYVLGGLLIAGLIFVPLIGVLQLKQDDRVSEKGFLELMKMVIGQLPLVGKMFGGKTKNVIDR